MQGATGFSASGRRKPERTADFAEIQCVTPKYEKQPNWQIPSGFLRPDAEKPTKGSVFHVLEKSENFAKSTRIFKFFGFFCVRTQTTRRYLPVGLFFILRRHTLDFRQVGGSFGVFCVRTQKNRWRLPFSCFCEKVDFSQSQPRFSGSFGFSASGRRKTESKIQFCGF